LFCLISGLAACHNTTPIPGRDLGGDAAIAADLSAGEGGSTAFDAYIHDPDLGPGDAAPVDAPAADAGAPDQTQPDLTPPDQTQPDLTPPDMLQPDQLLPDQMLPDMQQPDMAQPDMMPPDQMLPDTMPHDTYLPPVACKFTSPSRAAMLTGSPAITLKGKVTGPLSSLDYVQVNGKNVAPWPNGEFFVPMTAKWGLNIITLVCVDKAKNVDASVQAFHYSTKYWPLTSSGASVSAGALARLYQKAIDDGHRPSLNDMASILQKVINSLNFDKLVPSTLVSGKYKIPPWGPTISYSVTKNGKFKVNPFSIALKARSGGVRVTGKTSYLELPVRAKAGLTVSGKVKIYNLSMVGDVNISKKSGGAVSVSVPYLKMSYSSLKVEIGGGIIGTIMSAITNGIVSLFKNSIIAKMEAEVKKAIPGPVKSFVSGFTFAQSFKLPAVLGSKTLKIKTNLDTIKFDSYGGNIGMNPSVYASKAIPSGKLGSISIAGTYKPPASSSDAMLVGLRHDTLNQVLAAAWYTGALKRDLTSLVKGAIGSGSGLPFTVSNLKLTVDALLPPILMPGSSTNDFKIGVGDLKMKVSADLTTGSGAPSKVSADVYVSTVTGGTMKLGSNNTLTVTLSTQINPMEIQVDNLVILGQSTGLGGAFGLLIKELVKVVLPQLGPNIIQSFPIPAIDLSSLGGSYGIPKGTMLKLKNGKLKQQGNHVVLSGDLG